MILAYCSTIQFRFAGNLYPRGWLDILVIGDTRCGKTVTAEGLARHLGVGEIVKGENTSYAGLVGGLSQGVRSGKWDLVWGKIPLNDRKLLIVDETSSLSKDDIGNLSSLRSSGVAEITKIKAGVTHARTRMIWLSNPRGDGMRLANYDYAIEAISDLIGKPEDIARFDFALAVRETDVSSDAVNSRADEKEPTDNPAAMRSLVYWAWSLQPNDIIWSEDATDHCLALARKLAKDFDSSIPLVEQNEIRIKLARVAVAMAVRAYSEKEGQLRVFPLHVDAADEFMRGCYQTLDYQRLTLAKRQVLERNVSAITEVVKTLAKYGNKFTYECLFGIRAISMTDIENVLMLCRQEAREVVGTMIRFGLYTRNANGHYQKTPFLIQIMPDLLRRIKAEKGDGS